MKVVIIGTGNVATVLAKIISQSNHELIMIVGRNKANAKSLAQKLSTIYSTLSDTINPNADLYILSVSDNAIEDVVKKMQLPQNSIIVHTTGSASINILKNSTNNYGVLYPLQSIRKETNHIPTIPFFIDANNQETKEVLLSFAKSISPFVSEANDTQRLFLHIAAVFVSNFTNYLYAVGENICKKQEVDFSFLLPLITETALRLTEYSPEDMMTGPAIRNDKNTLEKHRDALKNNYEILELYNYLTHKIQVTFLNLK